MKDLIMDAVTIIGLVITVFTFINTLRIKERLVIQSDKTQFLAEKAEVCVELNKLYEVVNKNIVTYSQMLPELRSAQYTIHRIMAYHIWAHKEKRIFSQFVKETNTMLKEVNFLSGRGKGKAKFSICHECKSRLSFKDNYCPYCGNGIPDDVNSMEVSQAFRSRFCSLLCNVISILNRDSKVI